MRIDNIWLYGCVYLCFYFGFWQCEVENGIFIICWFVLDVVFVIIDNVFVNRKFQVGVVGYVIMELEEGFKDILFVFFWYFLVIIFYLENEFFVLFYYFNFNVGFCVWFLVV